MKGVRKDKKKKKKKKGGSYWQTCIQSKTMITFDVNLLFFFFFWRETFWERKNKRNKNNNIQLSPVDLLARVSMKNVAKCDK